MNNKAKLKIAKAFNRAIKLFKSDNPEREKAIQELADKVEGHNEETE